MKRILTIAAVSAVAIVVPVAGAQAATQRCGSVHLGTTHFSKIRAERVSCHRAKRLLDGATLAQNRRGASYWFYAAWEWSVEGLSETRSRI